jgi:pyruvate dehydrogenase E2 component (dihydrolipoamide acetyltransferase)
MSDTRTAELTTVTLPSLGADMDYGSVVSWEVAVGDRVERGDVVAIVETEKADVDVEVWSSGIVVELLAPLGEELPVGAPLLTIDGADAAIDAGSPSEPAVTETAKEAPAIELDPSPAHSEPVPVPTSPPFPKPTHRGSAARVAATPWARRAAEQREVRLESIRGSGPDGAVLARDLPRLDQATPSSSLEPRAERIEPPLRADRSIRAVIARRMTEANRTIPHYHLQRDIDVSDMLDALEAHNRARPIADRVLPAAVVLWAVARAAASVPALNGTWVDDSFQPSSTVDLAVAISLRSGGVVTPMIAGAENLDVSETMRELRLRTSGARRGALRSSWMAEASITVTNLGDLGADRVSGIIFPPQVALVGIGRIRRAPWVVDERVEPRSVLTATLSADHRATDGVVGSRFLAELDRHLQLAFDTQEET